MPYGMNTTLLLSFGPAKKEEVALPVQDSVGVAVSVKDMVKSPSPVRGFLLRGFLIRAFLFKLISCIKCRLCLR